MTHVNREWTFYFPKQWFCPNFQLNRFYKVSVKKLIDTNFIASKHITQREKSSLPVDVRLSKTLLLKLSNNCSVRHH